MTRDPAVAPAFDDQQLRQLVGQLNQAEAALQSFLGGQGDVVIDPINGVPVLLRQAQQALLKSEAYHRNLSNILQNVRDSVIVVDLDGLVTYWNEGATDIFGYTEAEMLGRSIEQLYEDGSQAYVYANLEDPQAEVQAELQARRKDGTTVWLDRRITVMRDEENEPLGQLRVSKDITERKQAELALRDSEARFATLFSASPAAISLTRVKDGHLIDVNKAFEQLLGYSRAEIINATATTLNLWPVPEERECMIEGLRAQRAVRDLEITFRRQDGALVETMTSLETISLFGEEYVVGLSQDLTRIRRAEVAIRESEAKFRALFEVLPVGVAIVDKDRHILDQNPALALILGTPMDVLKQGDYFQWTYLGSDGTPLTVADLPSTRAIDEHKPILDVEIQVIKDPQTIIWTSVSAAPVPVEGLGAVVVTTNITERKRAEVAVRESEARFRALIENSTDGIALIDLRGVVQYGTPAASRILGYSQSEFLGQSSLALIHPEDAPAAEAAVLTSARTPGHVEWAEYRARHKDGSWRWINGSVQNLLAVPGVNALVVNYRDVTESKRAELEILQRNSELAAIAALSTALRAATGRSQMPPIILDQLMEMFGADGASLVVPDPKAQTWVVELGRGEMAAAIGTRFPYDTGASRVVIATGQPYLIEKAKTDPNVIHVNAEVDALALAGVPLVTQRQTIGVLWVGRQTPLRPEEVRLLTAIADIAANAIQRASLHEQTQRQLNQLQSLRAIDQMIKSSLDLRLTFTVLLEHIIRQLQVDAASILLLNQHTKVLEYVAGQGFRKSENQKVRLHLGEGHAGRAAMQRQMVTDLNLQSSTEDSVRLQIWQREDFQVYFSLPLIAKGQVLGVLEIFSRSALRPNEDWLEFLAALADLTAIAIDNVQLFDNLQHSNLELLMAYNATIEGWSRALDLRDRETEGHSRRVTELTVELAQASGSFSEKEINHIRWGALLHDIGKMGIPDHILLKPGPLSSEEWDIMRRHPTYAYELLSPITFLYPALDIPYCHHEKWDGTGYPRGLKGDQIPLAARLFAIVDVWDALRSDRPYRAAWSVEKVRAHILALSGTHFDPTVVQTFMALGNETVKHLLR